MNLNREVMKTTLIRDKGFLKSLYDETNNNKKKILSIAEDSQLNTLIKYLHFLSKGEIEITNENFQKISKVLKLVKTKVEKKQKVSEFLKASRIDKIKFLTKLVNFYPALLYGLFNEQ